MRLPCLCLALSAALALASIASASRRTLVLLEDVASGSRYSSYLQTLRQGGYDLDIRAAKDPTLRIRQWDDWLYDKLIILASGVTGASLFRLV